MVTVTGFRAMTWPAPLNTLMGTSLLILCLSGSARASPPESESCAIGLRYQGNPAAQQEGQELGVLEVNEVARVLPLVHHAAIRIPGQV